MKKYCGHCGEELEVVHGTATIDCCAYPTSTGGKSSAYWHNGILYNGSLLGRPGKHYPLKRPNASNKST